MILERQEINEVTLRLPKLTALREFPGWGAGRGNLGGAQQNSWVEELELRIEGTQGSWSSHDRVLKRRELHRERTPDISRGPLEYSDY